MILGAIKLQAQEVKIDNLIVEGAGIRGLAYAGSIEELEKSNLIHQVKRVGGTSAGAITAMLLSLGYRSDEIKSIVITTPFHHLNQAGTPLIGGILRMHKSYGCYNTTRLDIWLGELIAAKTGNADITFEELIKSGFKDLWMTATYINKQKLMGVILHYIPFRESERCSENFCQFSDLFQICMG
jgi:Predicted esterase of the alpha-beta hydrolase superfamily